MKLAENVQFSLSIAFDENSQNFYKEMVDLIKDYTNVDMVAYHEGLLKERRKAFMLKGGYSARKTPFAVVFNLDRVPLKAFYTETDECTVENIKNYLDSLIN